MKIKVLVINRGLDYDLIWQDIKHEGRTVGFWEWLKFLYRPYYEFNGIKHDLWSEKPLKEAR